VASRHLPRPTATHHVALPWSTDSFPPERVSSASAAYHTPEQCSWSGTWCLNTVAKRYTSSSSSIAWLSMNGAHYKGFTITARTFQIRGSGRWTLDLLIGHREFLRAFSGAHTYGSEAAAVAGCLAFGQRVIDGGRPGCSLGDLPEDATSDRGFDPGLPGTHHPPH
jgi:hypothetical protein